MANQRRLRVLAIDDPDPKEMSIVEHLEELRSRLIVSLMAIAIASVGGWFLFQPALHLLVVPLPAQYHQLVFTTFTGAFTFRLKLSIIIGIMIAIPIWMYELWMFIVPAVEVSV